MQQDATFVGDLQQEGWIERANKEGKREARGA